MLPSFTIMPIKKATNAVDSPEIPRVRFHHRKEFMKESNELLIRCNVAWHRKRDTDRTEFKVGPFPMS
jgi:hypothetical protein